MLTFRIHLYFFDCVTKTLLMVSQEGWNYIETNAIYWFLTKEWRQFNRKRVTFSTNDAKTIGGPYAKKKEHRRRPYIFHKNLNGS